MVVLLFFFFKQKRGYEWRISDGSSAVCSSDLWMAILLYLAPRAKAFDRWTGADTSAIEDLKQRIADYQAEHARIPSMSDLMMIFAVGIGLTGLAHLLTGPLVAWIQSLPAS